MSKHADDDSVVLPLAALEKLLEKRRAESESGSDPVAVVIRIGETTLAEAERAVIERTLAACSGHKGKACEALKISRPTLARKLRSYGKAGGAA